MDNEKIERAKNRIREIIMSWADVGESGDLLDKDVEEIYQLSGNDQMTEEEEERVNKIISHLGEKPGESRWLTKEETEIAVNKWKNEDWATRYIRLNRGHYEEVLPLIAKAQDAKTAPIAFLEGYNMGARDADRDNKEEWQTKLERIFQAYDDMLDGMGLNSIGHWKKNDVRPRVKEIFDAFKEAGWKSPEEVGEGKEIVREAFRFPKR